jgi:hypothetical protein
MVPVVGSRADSRVRPDRTQFLWKSRIIGRAFLVDKRLSTPGQHDPPDSMGLTEGVYTLNPQGQTS